MLAALVTAWLHPVPGQGIDALPTEHVQRVALGAFVDLDSGIVLPARLAAGQADLVFDRDGGGFYVDAPAGAVPALPADTVAPERDAFARGRQRIDRRQAGGTWFVRTDLHAVARVTVQVIDPYSTASAVLTWVLAPPQAAEFWPAPEELAATFEGETLRVRWRAEEARFLVRVTVGEREESLTVARPEVSIERALGARCVVEVRGQRARGVVTLPARLVRVGNPRPAQRAVVTYPDRWYDGTGGLNLQRGEPATEDADIAFYLYGVYAPGGGVQKVGVGETAFTALATLPERGYAPSHGRLDAWDVLAVRIADGRVGKVMLVPTDRSNLRSGMRVVYAFLADGRTRFLPAPAAGAFAVGVEGVRVTWSAVEGAVDYRIAAAGRPVAQTRELRHTVESLVRDRFHRVSIVARDALGDESDPLWIEAHTFGEDHRVGTFRLRGNGRAGVDLATGSVVADAAEARDLDASLTNRAGNASFALDTPHGSAAANGLEFGVFPARDDARAFSDTITLDERFRASDIFLLRTRTGGLASVRVRVWSHEPEFDYVLRLK